MSGRAKDMISLAMEVDFERQTYIAYPSDLHVRLHEVIDVERAVKRDFRFFHMIRNARCSMPELRKNSDLAEKFDNWILAVVQVNGIVDMAIYIDIPH
ncbi:hypothetical protein RvVAR0630_pl03470 (plasmid) [Agrobacterium vitis]|nr:hypothetical protein RvVAR0630_pl03470 [Agrobacterium vitis]